jgi:hypothetical protein
MRDDRAARVSELRRLAEETAAAFQAEAKRIGNVAASEVIAAEMLQEIDVEMYGEVATLRSQAR